MAKTKAKRLLSLLLSLAMVMSLVVTPAFAITGAVEESVVTGGSSETNEIYATTGSVATVTSDSGKSVGCATLADAFAEAEDNDTITLNDNVTITDGEYSANGLYQVSTNVTLDLSNHTLTVNTARVFGVLNGGSLTVKNGTVKIADGATATGNQFNILRGTCSFTAENVTFNGNSIAANFLHVASGGTATIALTNCNITNQSGGVVVYDNDGNSTVTLTGCNYATNPSGGALNNIANFEIIFNSNNQITSESTNWEASNSLRYTYVVADGGSVAADLTLAATKGAASLTVEGGTVTGDVTVASGTSMTVSGGTVTGSITTSGTFAMSGGSVTSSSTSQAVLVKGGTVNISGGTISASSSRALVFDTDVTVNGTISGGTFSGNDIALLARSSSGNTVSVTGGTYTATKGIDLVASILANGYGVFDTAGNAATVSGNYYMSSLDDNTVVVSSGVASIGSTTYGTLQAAINAASSGATVTLLANTAEDVTIPESANITLDLAGKTLTNVSSHTITNYGTLTITDSAASSESCGTVDNVTHGKAAVYNEMDATCTILAGNFTRSKEAGTSSSNNGGNSYYTILNHGTMTIGSKNGDNYISVSNTGTYSSMIENGWQNGSQNTNGNNSTLTIYGGTFTGGLYNVKNDDYGVLYIYGGTFSGLNNILNWNVATISGGTFTSTNMGVYTAYSNNTMDQGTTTITDGTFTSSGKVLNVYNSGATYSVSGGTFSQEVDSEYCADGYVPTENSSGTYGVTKFYLGISTDSDGAEESVPASVDSGYGESVMYVKVSADNIESYTTEKYPTTSLTYAVSEDNTTDSGKYIFAGWYTLSDGSYTACTAIPTTDAYAKFVDANALRVICVYTPASLSATGKDALRFLSSMDSLDCLSFSFVVNETSYSCTGYATSCKVSNSSMNRTFTKADISSASNYLMTYRIYQDTLADNYSVYACWTTADGTTVSGATLTFTSSSLNGATVLGE